MLNRGGGTREGALGGGSPARERGHWTARPFRKEPKRQHDAEVLARLEPLRNFHVR